jgi:fatty acid desaturase
VKGRPEYRIPGTLNLVLLIAAMSACCGALWLAAHGNWWQVVLAVVAFSFLNNTLFSLLHEAVHGIAHPVKRLNEAIGCVAAAFFPTGLTLQRMFHLSHHAHNRSVQEQFDYIRPFDRPLLKHAQWYSILTGLYWLFVPVGALVYFFFPFVLSSHVLRSRSSAAALQTGSASMFQGLRSLPPLRARIELLFTACVQLGLFRLLDLRLLPWLACYAAFALNWSSLQYADHAFSPLHLREGAWNLKVNPVTRLLFLNYHHHRAHHTYPDVSWLHLGELVGAAEERPSFWSIYLRMWRGPRPISEAVPEFQPVHEHAG